MSSLPQAPQTPPPPQSAVNFLDTMERTRLSMADAAGMFTDEQLCQTYKLTPRRLAEMREDPRYQHLYTEQLNKFQASMASRYFELQTLGDTALANARYYLDNRQMTKENLDMTKFILSKVLPNPEQAVKVTTNNQPHLSVEATVILNERLPMLAVSMEGAPVGRLEDDPNLRRGAQ